MGPDNPVRILPFNVSWLPMLDVSKSPSSLQATAPAFTKYLDCTNNDTNLMNASMSSTIGKWQAGCVFAGKPVVNGLMLMLVSAIKMGTADLTKPMPAADLEDGHTAMGVKPFMGNKIA